MYIQVTQLVNFRACALGAIFVYIQQGKRVMNRTLIIASVAFISTISLGVAGCAVLPKNEVRTEALIPAAPETVWSVLTDAGGHSTWNPFIVEMDGAIVEGKRLAITLEPTPGDLRTFKPTILRVTPNEELRWLGRAGIPGIFDGEHYFILQPIPEGTRLIHGERFSGFALWFIDTHSFEDNFLAMNVALAERVNEQLPSQENPDQAAANIEGPFDK